MKLSQRLKAIYDLVNSPCVLADIGTDHALLPIALVQGGKALKAYACDVAAGPLQRAQQAIAKAKLADKIETRLQNGLQTLPDDVDSVVIAGMGSDTIISILSADYDYAQKLPQLILQSNAHVDTLRRWLNEHHFMITHEELVHEGHYYQILCVCAGEQHMCEAQLHFGYDLYQHPLFDQWMEEQLRAAKRIAQQLPESHEDYPMIARRLHLIEEAMKKDCFTQS